MKTLFKTGSDAPAFTLLEMIIAITVFTIFIGFTISAYLVFHRADQETIEIRSLLLELEGTMDQISKTLQDNKVDYDSVASSGMSLTDAIHSSTLTLISPDGATQYAYYWDQTEETLTYQVLEWDETEAVWEASAGYLEPVLLHGENTRVTYANFRIFPSVNPYGTDNAADDEAQFQPMVQIKLSFTVPGRVRSEVSLDLQTSVTSRFYQ